MNIAPLVLKHSFITEFHLVTRQDYDPKKGHKYNMKNLQSDVKYLTSKEYPGVWQVPLNLKCKPQPGENIPYGFTITIVGFFKIRSEWTKSRRESLIRINAPAVLYGATRELIAILSGRGPWGPILLPSVNFLPKFRRTKKKSNRAKETSLPQKRKKNRAT
jgi:preprotein translocase subunit SecB